MAISEIIREKTKQGWGVFSVFTTLLGLASYTENLETWRRWISSSYNWVVALVPSPLDLIFSLLKLIPILIEFYRAAVYPVVETLLPDIKLPPWAIDIAFIALLTVTGGFKLWIFAKVRWTQTVSAMREATRMELEERGKGFVEFFFERNLARSTDMKQLKARLLRIRVVGTAAILLLLAFLFAVDYYVRGNDGSSVPQIEQLQPSEGDDPADPSPSD